MGGCSEWWREEQDRLQDEAMRGWKEVRVTHGGRAYGVGFTDSDELSCVWTAGGRHVPDAPDEVIRLARVELLKWKFGGCPDSVIEY